MGDPPTIQPIVLRLSSESGLTISEVIEALYAPAEYEKATAVKKPRNPRRRLSKFKPYETEPADLTSEIWTPETALEGTLPSQNGLGDVQPFAPTPPSILQLVHFSPSPSEGEEQVSVKSSLAVSLPRSHRPVECAGAGSPRSAPEIIDAGANSDVELIEPPAAPCVKSKTPLFLSNPDSDTEVDAARVSENLHDDSTTPLTIKLPASVAFAVASLVFGKLGAILQPLTPLLGPTASNPLNPPPQMHLDDQQATPELRASSIARGRRLDRSRARDFLPVSRSFPLGGRGSQARIPTGDTRRSPTHCPVRHTL
ncbi:hypothetical protein DFH09DRAFT_1373293 [Mycena vulgaris]|nr:hypothetical protein DFH09DRAFT_1373293 [Mycena vulgaris]